MAKVKNKKKNKRKKYFCDSFVNTLLTAFANHEITKKENKVENSL